LLGLLFDPEVGGDMFLLNVGLALSFMTIKPSDLLVICILWFGPEFC
jgi:hypothetical protein